MPGAGFVTIMYSSLKIDSLAAAKSPSRGRTEEEFVILHQLKRAVFLAPVLCFALVLAGCGNPNANDNNSNDSGGSGNTNGSGDSGGGLVTLNPPNLVVSAFSAAVVAKDGSVAVHVVVSNIGAGP